MIKQNNTNKEGFIPQNGGYKNLITFQKAEIIYDGTIYFTKRFFKKYDSGLLKLRGRYAKLIFEGRRKIGSRRVSNQMSNFGNCMFR